MKNLNRQYPRFLANLSKDYLEPISHYYGQLPGITKNPRLYIPIAKELSILFDVRLFKTWTFNKGLPELDLLIVGQRIEAKVFQQTLFEIITEINYKVETSRAEIIKDAPIKLHLASAISDFRASLINQKLKEITELIPHRWAFNKDYPKRFSKEQLINEYCNNSMTKIKKLLRSGI